MISLIESDKKQARLSELQRQDAETVRLRSLLKPGMNVVEVTDIYPAFGALMSWGAQCLGRDFTDFSEFLDYYEGRKEYPKNMKVNKRFAS